MDRGARFGRGVVAGKQLGRNCAKVGRFPSFRGGVRLSATNNYVGGSTPFAGITFAPNAESFILTGNGFPLTGDIVNNSPVLQTLTTFSGNGITISEGNRTFHAAAGDLLFTTTVSVGPNVLTTQTAEGRTVTINGSIQHGSQGSGGGLRVSGAGATVLGGVNTYAGLTTIASGTLSINSGDNLQATSGIVFEHATDSTLHAAGSSINLTRNITQTGVGNYEVTTGKSLVLSGTISGGGDLNLKGGGVLSLTASNTFTGATVINTGTLAISSGDNLQGTSAVVFEHATDSTLHAEGSSINLTRNIIQTGIGNYEVATGKSLVLSGTISGGGDLNFKGGGVLSLTGNNTFTGATTINTGTLAINSAANLQSSSSIIFGGATSTLYATVDGINLDRNISQVSRGNYLVDGGNTLTVTGTISGIGQLHKNGEGLLVLDAANTYTGRTVVNSGTLRLGSGGTITNANMDISGGVFDLNGKNISLSNTLTVGLTDSSGTILSSNGTSTFSVGNEIIVRSGTVGVNLTGNAILSKRQQGTVVLTGSNSYTGATSVTSGTLVVDGSIQSDVTVSEFGVLGGSGIINGSVTVQSGAALRPGSSPGILTSGDFTLEVGGLYGVEIAGYSPGAGGYDSLVVNGDVTLSGDLDVSLSFTPVNGSLFFIIVNNGTNAIAGAFNGLAQNDVFLIDDQYFRISYNANAFEGTYLGGNDIALEAIPEPGVLALFGFGAAYLMFRRRTRAV